MIYFVAATIFFLVLLLFLIIFKMLDERISSKKRVKTYGKQIQPNMEEGNQEKGKAVYKSLLKPLSTSMKKVRFSKKWEEKLRRADIPLKGEEFLAIWYSMIIATVVFMVINVKFILLLILAILYPPIYIQSKINKRVKKFDSQLNDALAILANSLRAGFSFFQAMDTVRREMPDPISKEFTKTLKEINFGTPVEEALQNMSERLGSQDLDLVITAVMIQRQVGGNMAEILETISQTIRERIKILGEIKTLTAQGRVSGYIIGGLPIVLLVVLSFINPDYINVLFQNKIGWGILAGGAVSEIFGILLIKKIISIEV